MLGQTQTAVGSRGSRARPARPMFVEVWWQGFTGLGFGGSFLGVTCHKLDRCWSMLLLILDSITSRPLELEKLGSAKHTKEGPVVSLMDRFGW